MAKQLNIIMKISEVEFQADGRKATFFYTAEDRVDFRELIKLYAGEFKVKVEMKQIGARQEAAKVGGILANNDFPYQFLMENTCKIFQVFFLF